LGFRYDCHLPVGCPTFAIARGRFHRISERVVGALGILPSVPRSLGTAGGGRCDLGCDCRRDQDAAARAGAGRGDRGAEVGGRRRRGPLQPRFASRFPCTATARGNFGKNWALRSAGRSRPRRDGNRPQGNRRKAAADCGAQGDVAAAGRTRDQPQAVHPRRPGGGGGLPRARGDDSRRRGPRASRPTS